MAALAVTASGCRLDSDADPRGNGLGDASVTWLDEAGVPNGAGDDPASSPDVRSGATTAPQDAERACAPSDRCVVVPADCCAALEGQTDRSVVTAVREEVARAYVDRLCRSASCSPSGGNLGPTTWAPDPHLGATCSLGRCTVVDARDRRYAACTRDGDCEVRCGAGCSFGCGCPEGRAIALAGSRAFDRDVCPFGVSVACVVPNQSLPFLGSAGARCIEGRCGLSDDGSATIPRF